MTVHILSNLLKELRKGDKMPCLRNILSSFRNELDIFNNKRSRIFYSIYYMTLELSKSQFKT